MEKNLYLLPTDKPSRLIIYSALLNEFRLLAEPIEDWKHKRNVYVTSDEEPKYKDFYITDGTQIYYCNTLNPTRNNHYKKIILTTDPDLIKNGIQAIDDEFLEWFVRNPSCEKVDFNSIPRCCGRCNGEDDLCYSDMTCDNHKERGCEICYGKRVEYLITIPKEESKQETLEEAAGRIRKKLIYAPIGIIPNFNDGFEEGTKWQQEQDKNKYNEEEVKSFLNSIISEIGLRKENIEKNQDKMPIHLLEGGLMAFESSIDVIKESFEEFKKK